jgi:hypothetical protein
VDRAKLPADPGEVAERWLAPAIDGPEPVTVFQWHGEDVQPSTRHDAPGCERLLKPEAWKVLAVADESENPVAPSASSAK